MAMISIHIIFIFNEMKKYDDGSFVLGWSLDVYCLLESSVSLRVYYVLVVG